MERNWKDELRHFGPVWKRVKAGREEKAPEAGRRPEKKAPSVRQAVCLMPRRCRNGGGGKAK